MKDCGKHGLREVHTINAYGSNNTGPYAKYISFYAERMYVDVHNETLACWFSFSMGFSCKVLQRLSMLHWREGWSLFA